MDNLRGQIFGACLVIFALLPGGCTWNKSADTGSQVRKLEAGEIGGCEKIAVTHVSIMDKLESMSKAEGDVAAELTALARKSALQFGGNAIVELTEIRDGTQSFAIFSCRQVK